MSFTFIRGCTPRDSITSSISIEINITVSTCVENKFAQRGKASTVGCTDLSLQKFRSARAADLSTIKLLLTNFYQFHFCCKYWRELKITFCNVKRFHVHLPYRSAQFAGKRTNNSMHLLFSLFPSIHRFMRCTLKCQFQNNVIQSHNVSLILK